MEGHEGVDPRTTASLNERVVRVETKLESVTEGIGVIRGTIHNINNRMQEFVAAEYGCRDALGSIKATLEDWKPRMNQMLQDQGQRVGQRSVWFAVSGIVGGLLTMAGVIIALLALLYHK